MKQLFTFVLGLCVFPAFAQITITANDMPVVNDTVRYSTSLTPVTKASLEASAGPNQTWDFMHLVPDFQEMAKFSNALSLSYLSFFSSSFGTKDNDFNFNIPIPGGTGAATNVYNFYTKSAGSYVMDGRGFTFQGLPLPQTFTPKEVLYQFPLTYRHADSTSFSSNTVSILIATLRTSGKRVNLVDGWGTLTTPYGTFNCLRVKSTVQDTDYITVTGLPFGIPLPRVSTEYKWLATGKKIPVLEISIPSTGNPTIKYRDINRPELFASLADFTANKTSFDPETPNDTCILTDNSARNPVSVQWTITPATYKFTGGTNATSSRPKIFFTASGKYTVKLKAQYSAGSDEVTKTDYLLMKGNMGIGELDGPYKVSLYPNPAHDQVELELSKNLVERIEVYDVTGKQQEITLLWNNPDRCTMDCSTLHAGIYSVMIRFTDKETAVKRIAIR